MKTPHPLLLLLIATWNAFSVRICNGQWNLLNSPSDKDLFIDVHFIDRSTGYILGLNGQTINYYVLKTVDAGEHWDPATESIQALNPLSIFFTSENTGYIASTDKLSKTINGGSTWITKSLGLGENIFVGNLFFQDAITGYASALNIMNNKAYQLYTKDGGANWNFVEAGPAAESGSKAIYCTGSEVCYSVGPYGEQGVFKTIDGGQSWTKILNIAEHSFNSVYFTSPEKGVVVGGSMNSQKIYLTGNRGTNWEKVFDEEGKTLMCVGFLNSLHGFAVGKGGSVVSTTDGGATWKAQESPATNDLYSLHCVDANTAYAVGASGTILKYSTPSGVDNPESVPDQIRIYYNSSNGTIVVKLDEEWITNEMALTIYNCHGVKILEQKFTSSEFHIPASYLGNGIFFYFLRQDQQAIDRGKLVVL